MANINEKITDMVRPCGEKQRRRCRNENMADGSGWTSKDKKTKTEVE